LTHPQEVISIVDVCDSSDIYEAVKKGIELIGVPAFKSSDVVAIKPNLCCIKGPETGATTDPRVIEAIVTYLQKEFKITDISIVESDGTQLVADMAFKLLGYEGIAKKLGVKLVNLSKDESTTKIFENNLFLKKVRYPQTIEKANWLISVPKIKTHTLCKLGGTMKNQYGCNPYPKKTIYHKHILDCVVDLSKVFKPHLIVVDGLIGMEGRGPVSGIPVKLNSLIFGKDIVAMDHLLAKIIGENPKKVKYIAKAEKQGLGTTNYKVVGRNLNEIQHNFKTVPKMSNLFGLSYQ
jgi:uncharacterized protein (DUF362 family)